jgi:hypothetical protein
VVESPIVQSIGEGGLKDFQIECEFCSSEIELDDEHQDFVINLMRMYDFGVNK